MNVEEEYYGLCCPTFEDHTVDEEMMPDFDEAHSTVRFSFDENQQRRVLSVILRDVEVARLAAERLTPMAFTHKAHQAVASFTFSFLESYGGLPTDDIVMGDLKQKWANVKSQDPLLDEVQKVLGYSAPDGCERQFYCDEIVRLAKSDLFRRTFTDGLKAIEKGNYDFGPMISALQEAQSLSGDSSSTLEAFDAIEFFDMAGDHERSWLLNDWICEGSLHLFAGQKKIGKSTLLHSMIAALMSGKDWFESIGCQQVPVVYLDFENPSDYIKDNLLKMMPKQDYEPVRQLLRVPKSLPSALTGDWLMRFLEHNKLTEYQSGVILIDSARRAFNGLFPNVSNWENNASEVSRCMQPMLSVARETNFAVVVIHHDNKSNDSAGSVDWEAVCDFVWHYTAKGTERVLASKHGRYVGRQPESMVFHKPEDQLLLAGLSGDIRAERSRKKRQSKLDDLCRDLVPYIPELPLDSDVTTKNSVTVHDLAEATSRSRDALQKELRTLRDEGIVQYRKLESGRSKPLHYWRHNQSLA